MDPSFFSRKQLYLAIDQGGHATRAIAFDGSGEVVAETFQDIHVHHPQPDFVEHDAAEMLQSLRHTLDGIAEKLGERTNEIVAAGLATQRSNIVCWHKHTGEALSPIISWQDRRNAAWLKQFEPRAEEIHKITGLFLSPHYGASKMRWCLEHYAEVRHALEEGVLCLGPMASYFVFQLTKEQPFLTDVVNASRTQLWSLQSNDWDPSLLKLFDIPAQALPQCRPTSSDYGHLQLGERDIPLKLVTGDQSAAMFAYGQVQPDTAYVNTGTGAFVSRPSGPLKIYGRRLLTSVVEQSAQDTRYVLEGTVNGAGSALSWFTKKYHVTHLQAALGDWLEEIKEPPLFLNGVSGLASPYWIADFPTRFIPEDSSEPGKAVAVIESIVFLLCINIEEMKKLSSPPEQIQITGGLAVLDGLCQRLADISRLPIYRPVECEATARGLAYLLAGQPASWPETNPGVWFMPSNNTALLDRYERWSTAMLTALRY